MSETAGDDNLFRVLFNSIPLPLFRVDRELGILDLNQAAEKLFNTPPDRALRMRGGDLLHCINALTSPNGCGSAEACADCLIRNSVKQVFANGREINRLRTTMIAVNVDQQNEVDLLLTATPIHFAGELSVLLCLEDISELTSLRSLIPICASCKKIRDDQQLWNSVESYFSHYHRVDFTHSICPDCARRLYPELNSTTKD